MEVNIIKKLVKKMLNLTITITTILSIFAIGVSAEWKQDNTGWWYAYGNYWDTGWNQIDGKWYFFDSNGYMEHDTTIDGYYLNSSGVWTDNNLDNNNLKTSVSIFYHLDNLKIDRMIQGKVSLKNYYGDDINKKLQIESMYGMLIIDSKDYGETAETLIDNTMIQNEYKIVKDNGIIKFVKNK